jgi:hypothetical protein
MCYRRPQFDEEQTGRQMSRLVSKNTYMFQIVRLFPQNHNNYCILYNHYTVVHKEGQVERRHAYIIVCKNHAHLSTPYDAAIFTAKCSSLQKGILSTYWQKSWFSV